MNYHSLSTANFAKKPGDNDDRIESYNKGYIDAISGREALSHSDEYIAGYKDGEESILGFGYITQEK